MLYDLVKKDFLLAKKYLIVMLIAAFAIPIFITSKIGSNSGGFLNFFITVIYIEYMLLSTVSLNEHKYKGAGLLSTTPYTRDTLVKAKYLFILMIFLFCYIIYTITSIFTTIPVLTINTIGISFLLITALFGVIIPIQYQFGYEKTKYIGAVFICISPFVFPKLLDFIKSNNISLQSIFPFSKLFVDLFIYFISLVIGYISMIISTYIYSKKNL